MPYTKKSYKKKTYKKRIPKTPMTTYPLSTTVVSPRVITKLKYCEALSINTNGGIYDYVYNLNGLYDPNSTGTGHQPYGFDQLCILYSRYRVIRCSWNIEFPGSNDQAHVVVVPVNGNAALASISYAGELPRAVTKCLSYSSSPQTHFKGSIQLHRLAGSTYQQFIANDRYTGTTTSNPTETMHLHIVMESTASIVLKPIITLIYETEFFDANDLGQS